MKLNELKTVTPKELTPKLQKQGDDFRAALKNVQPPENMRVLGSGSYAQTYSNEDEPGTVTRVTRRVQNPNQDAYYKYLSAIAKSDRIQRNPYFPKIYSVKVTQDMLGNHAYSVDMERLLDFDTLSPEECVMLGERMFFNFTGFTKAYVARRKEIAPTHMRDKISVKDKGTAGFVLLKAIEKCINYGEEVATYVKDPRLKEAMIILRSLIKKNREMSSDIHDGNIMVRRGPGGPQLVITDPVA